MCDSQELTERFRRMLQRNAAVPRPADQIAEGERFKDTYGHRVTVINAAQGRVTYRRDEYGNACELSTHKFLKKFTRASQ